MFRKRPNVRVWRKQSCSGARIEDLKNMVHLGMVPHGSHTSTRVFLFTKLCSGSVQLEEEDKTDMIVEVIPSYTMAPIVEESYF